MVNNALDFQNLDLPTALLELGAAVKELDSLGAVIVAQRKQIAKLREALKPFASWAGVVYAAYDADHTIDMFASADELRKARAVLETELK